LGDAGAEKMDTQKAVVVISKIDPEDVAELVRESYLLRGDVEDKQSFVIIDVRDNDYIGGHIRGACNIPVSSFMENSYVIDQLIEKFNKGPKSTT
jgi:3-mercaptopyruvate sulfurtransferase SseA